MMNRIIRACFILMAFSSSTIAQDMVKTAEDKDSKNDTKVYHIRSLEGKDCKVYIMPDYFNHLLKMSCLQDTLTLTDYWGVPADVTILNNAFLEVEYEVRGGSGTGWGNVILLCVSGDKLCQAMHVLNHSNSESGEERDNFDIKIKLNGLPKTGYKLNVAIHDKVWTKNNPEANYDYHNHTVLDFDTKQHVFYSVKEDIYDSFIMDAYAKGKKRRQKIGGIYPAIILGKETFYFIKGEWYYRGDNNEYFMVRQV